MPGWDIWMAEKERWENGMDKKILILSQTTKDDYALLEWQKNDVNTGITLKDCNKVLRAVRRLWIKFHLPFQYIWYGDWKNHLDEYDMIILHGTWLAEDIPHWIKKKTKKTNSELKLIWWYWNHVISADHPNRVSGKDCEKWSFDQGDCEIYNMKYNTQYYFATYQLPTTKVVTDVCYLGTDGGRKEKLIALQKQLEEHNITTDFRILVQNIPDTPEKGITYFTEKVDYIDNLRQIGQSKAIVEILREGQSGQTLRPLEAMFHKKKLITNDLQIVEYDYYCPENIFVLGLDDMQRMPEFLNTAYREQPPHIRNKYECKAWLERFYKE